jgi:hypothetical protein
MALTQRNYNRQWENLIVKELNRPKTMMRQGNFYRLEVYKYADEKIGTKRLVGIDTCFVFIVGRFVRDGHNWLASIKLKQVNPDAFFEGIKRACRPLANKDFDEWESWNFKDFMKKYPADGKPLFEYLKTKPRIYRDTYREYKLVSIKDCNEVVFNIEYLKTWLVTIKDETDPTEDEKRSQREKLKQQKEEKEAAIKEQKKKDAEKIYADKKIAEKEVESKETKTVEEAGIETSKNIYGED